MNEIPFRLLDESQKSRRCFTGHFNLVRIMLSSDWSWGCFSSLTQDLPSHYCVSLNLRALPFIVLYLESDSSEFFEQDIYSKVRRCLSASLSPFSNSLSQWRCVSSLCLTFPVKKWENLWVVLLLSVVRYVNIVSFVWPPSNGSVTLLELNYILSSRVIQQDYCGKTVICIVRVITLFCRGNRK